MKTDVLKWAEIKIQFFKKPKLFTVNIFFLSKLSYQGDLF